MKGKGTMLGHGRGEVSHERESLGMEVPEEGVAFPTAHQANDISVNASAKKGHGPTTTQTAGFQTGRGDSKFGKGQEGVAEGGGDVAGADGGDRGGGVDSVDRGVGGGIVEAQVADTIDEGDDGTREGGIGATVSNTFAPDPTLLVGESEISMGGAVEEGKVSRVGWVLDGAPMEDDVTEAEGSAAGIRTGLAYVFTGPTEVVETDVDKVRNGAVKVGEGMCSHVADEVKGDGLNAGRR